jgi:hypothetical protein
MKKVKNQIKAVATMLFLGLGIMSCQKSEVTVIAPASNVKSEKNASEYSKLMNARANFKGYPFDILEIKRTENLLKVMVEGGCDTQAYRVIWDGVINFTEPTNPTMILGSTNLIISHEPISQVQCLAIMKHTIDVDLKILLGNTYTPTINVQVSNASKVDDKIVDPKGIVTTRNK